MLKKVIHLHYFIHLSSNTLRVGRGGGWGGWRRRAAGANPTGHQARPPWTVHCFTAWPHVETDNHSHSFQTLEPIQSEQWTSSYMFLDRGRKPWYTQGEHAKSLHKRQQRMPLVLPEKHNKYISLLSFIHLIFSLFLLVHTRGHASLRSSHISTRLCTCPNMNRSLAQRQIEMGRRQWVQSRTNWRTNKHKGGLEISKLGGQHKHLDIACLKQSKFTPDFVYFPAAGR